MWQWMRFPGDVVFALGAVLMTMDFIIKLGPLYPALGGRRRGSHPPAPSGQPDRGSAGAGAGRVMVQPSSQDG